jgi:hypothetical protein
MNQPFPELIEMLEKGHLEPFVLVFIGRERDFQAERPSSTAVIDAGRKRQDGQQFIGKFLCPYI